MFPTLRLILAGVSALFLVTLGALSLTNSPSERTAVRVATASFGPRGAMISQDDHPEWRQFRMQAAMQRAGTLAKLTELPDQPDQNAIHLRWASLPVEATEHAPEDVVEEISELPAATIPIDIGAASSTELPVTRNDETAPPPAMPRARGSDAAPDTSVPDPAVEQDLPPPAASADPTRDVSATDATATVAPIELKTPETAPSIAPPAIAKPATTPARTAAPAKRKVRRTARRANPAPPAPQPANPFAALFGQSSQATVNTSTTAP